MSYENPAISHPDRMPPNIQWPTLLKEPGEVLHEHFSPAEKVVFKYVSWIADTLQVGLNLENPAELMQMQSESVTYVRTSPKDFISPSQFKFAIKRNEGDGNKGFLEFAVDIGDKTDEKYVEITIYTETMPSLTDESEDIQEVFTGYEMMLATDSKVSYVIHSESLEQTDQDTIDMFTNTFTVLKKMVDTDYGKAENRF